MHLDIHALDHTCCFALDNWNFQRVCSVVLLVPKINFAVYSSYTEILCGVKNQENMAQLILEKTNTMFLPISSLVVLLSLPRTLRVGVCVNNGQYHSLTSCHKFIHKGNIGGPGGSIKKMDQKSWNPFTRSKVCIRGVHQPLFLPMLHLLQASCLQITTFNSLKANITTWKVLLIITANERKYEMVGFRCE